MAIKQYEAIVIGAGPAGYVCAIRLAQLGVQTAIIEKESLGGVCLNWGCIPSKAFIHVAKLYEEMQHAAEFGITVSQVSLDAKKLQSWKESVVQQLTGGVGQLLKANKVEKLAGQATFKDANTLLIQRGGESSEIAFKRCVIAVGGKPIEIPGFKIDAKDVLDAKAALGLTEIPKRLVVIGGGVIGLEMATFFSKFGSQVTVVEWTEQLLPGTDLDLVRVVERRLKKNGVNLHTSAKAKGWKKSATGLSVEFETKDGSKQVEADKILLAVGVRPHTQELGLEKIGIKIGEKGFIQVDPQRRTNLPHIFAIGDVAGQPMLAHKGSKEGCVVADVIAGKNSIYDVRAMPAAIFTDPEIATVGLSEAAATAAGHKVKVGKFPFAASGKALAMSQGEGFVKIIGDATTDRVLGMQIVGPNAADLIAEGALAIEMGATVEDISLTVHTHPTLPEAIMEAAEGVHGMAIHNVNKR